MHILIDGDPIVYSRGMAGEKRSYEVLYWEDGELQQAIFEDGREKNRWIKEEQIEVEDDQLMVQPLSPAFACAAVKRTLEALLNEVSDHFSVPKDQTSFEVYLTGGGNFREMLARERPYKGNRDRSLRPVFYQECRDYLVERWGATIIEDREADDEISIAARQLWDREIPHVIATVDKDLDQIPGPHYDYNKKVWYHVEEDEARWFFYEQILQGDSTDNIPGVYRLGKAKAHNLIQEWLEVAYKLFRGDVKLTEEFLWDQIVGVYAESMATHPDRYVGTDPEQVALENARLVKMQEYEGQLWTPPQEMDEILELSDG